MSKRVQLRRGTDTEHNTFTGADGEVTVDTTNKTLRVHDGTTAGGTRLATLTGGLVPVSQLPDATTSVKGVVVLNNTLTSTSTTQALTAAQGKVLGDRDFGVSQTVQNVSASRATNTTYTNSTGRPIFVAISTVGSGTANYDLLVDGVVFCTATTTNQDAQKKPLCAVVPSGSTYRLNTSFPFDTWSELR